MINFIQGKVKDNQAEYQVIAINDNLWLNIFTPINTRKSINQTAELYTYFHWNQENGPSIFGFDLPETRDIFCLLIECNGIGPKAALSILNQTDTGTVINAIYNKDSKGLSKLNGIGPKKAEQIILSLYTKVTKLVNDGKLNLLSEKQNYFADLQSVLVSLSYSRVEIEDALDYLRGMEHAPQGFDEALRKSLSFLTKSR